MRLRNWAINIFTSGKSWYTIRRSGFSDYLVKYILMNFMHIAGFVIPLLFVAHNVRARAYFAAAACASLAFMAVTGFIISRTRAAQMVPAVISSVSYGLFCVLIIWNGGAQGAGFLFIFIYPLLMIILLGMVKGIVFSVVLLMVVMVEFTVPGASRFAYHPDVALRMVAVYMLILTTTLVFETSRSKKERINAQLTRKIRGINANLQQMVAERTHKIVKLQNALLKTMSNLVEYRDFTTGGHIERTQYGVSLLLDEIQKQKLFAPVMQDWDIDLILQSVQLHDIGKIAISDLILNKPAALTAEEYDAMKKHTVYGFDIIERIEAESGESELLNHAKILALTHHEQWDGAGYPHGLRGEDIPLQGRIMAIADVYDALISDRPYKKAFTHEKAAAIIMKGKGTRFDPVLVDIFARIKDKL